MLSPENWLPAVPGRLASAANRVLSLSGDSGGVVPAPNADAEETLLNWYTIESSTSSGACVCVCVPSSLSLSVPLLLLRLGFSAAPERTISWRTVYAEGSGRGYQHL